MKIEPENMTGAELQTLRESCGLSREEFAKLATVQARTVKHWETRDMGVPADVAKLATELDIALREVVNAHTKLIPSAGGSVAVLTRYREGDPMPRAQWGAIPPSMQGACVARVRLALLDAGVRVRVVWFDANCTDPRKTLAQQAVAHRADQPPGA